MVYKIRLFTVALVAVLVVALSGCFHRMAPTSTGGNFKQNANSMVYTVTPYGSISLPGTWIAGKYNKASHQQYFYRSDTTTMIVSIGACSNYPFAKGGIDGYEFVRRYYDAEARYQVQLMEQTPRMIVEDEKNRYKLWMVHADGIDQYYLCGVKDCACKECTYRTLTLKNRRLTEKQAVKLLQDVFLGEG